MPTIQNITTHLEPDMLLVKWSMSYSIDESSSNHPDNPVREMEESRGVHNIHSFEYLFSDKIGCQIVFPAKEFNQCWKMLGQKLLDAVEFNSIEEIKLM